MNCKKRIGVLVLLLTGFLVSAMAQQAASIPSDYPNATTVGSQIKSNRDVASGLSKLGLTISQAKNITVIDFVPDRVDIPTGWPANTVTMKAFIDFAPARDGTFKRVAVALMYKRTVTERSTGPWTYSAIAENLSWFDEAHDIAADGTDLTHKKRVEAQQQQDAAAAAARNNAKAGVNPPDLAKMKEMVQEGAAKKPRDVFDHDFAKLEITDIVIDQNTGFTGQGKIGSYKADIIYKFNGATYSQLVKVQCRRDDENSPWRVFTVKGEGSAKRR